MTKLENNMEKLKKENKEKEIRGKWRNWKLEMK